MSLGSTDATGNMVLNYKDDDRSKQIKFINLMDFDIKVQMHAVDCTHADHPVYYTLWKDSFSFIFLARTEL